MQRGLRRQTSRAPRKRARRAPPDFASCRLIAREASSACLFPQPVALWEVYHSLIRAALCVDGFSHEPRRAIHPRIRISGRLIMIVDRALIPTDDKIDAGEDP